MNYFKVTSFVIVLLLGCIVSNAQEITGQQVKTNTTAFRKSKNNGTYVIAHRGAHIGIPENSLPAYQKAIDLGCDFVRIDSNY